MKGNPLLHPGWIRYLEETHRLEAEEVSANSTERNQLDVVFFRDRSNRMVHPAGSPFLPSTWRNVEAETVLSESERLSSIESIAQAIDAGRPRRFLHLCPSIIDARPFSWRGMGVIPRYTYSMDLRSTSTTWPTKTRGKIRKALRNGYRCEVSDDVGSVAACLRTVEARAGFSHAYGASELRTMLAYIGEDGIAPIICRDTHGVAVGAAVRLFSEGGGAIGLAASMSEQALRDGCNSLMHDFVVDYLRLKRCRSYDLAGGNLRNVAAFKRGLGAVLRQYLAVTGAGLEGAAYTAAWLLRARRRHNANAKL